MKAKYSKLDSHGNPLIQKMPIASLGVHPQNRNGLYCSGACVKRLAIDVLCGGFSKDEVNRDGVAIEEVPLDKAATLPSSYESLRKYNQTKSSEDTLLFECFKTHDNLAAGCLTHNHIMLFTRAVLVGAKWDVAPISSIDLAMCDAKGCLSHHAITSHPNGKELGDLLLEGMNVQLLSWKIIEEEPMAAGIISAAANRGQALALRTTEVQALKVLQGEIMFEVGANVSQKVMYAAVAKRCRVTLAETVDDPYFEDLFSLLLSLGAGANSYADDFFSFCEKFVDPKLRRVEFSTFAMVNSIHDCAPLTKVAVLKRAYRKKPVHGVCPPPEGALKKVMWPMMENLERLLHYFHVTCKSRIDDTLAPQSRFMLLCNVDTESVDAFVRTKPWSSSTRHAAIRQALLDATQNYAQELHLDTDPIADTQCEWIRWAQSSNKRSGEVIELEHNRQQKHAKILRFDHDTGHKIADNTPIVAVAEDPCDEVFHWKEWHVRNPDLGQNDAMFHIVAAALAHLYKKFKIVDMPIDVVLKKGDRFKVVATADIDTGKLCLPPCVPRKGKVTKSADHPDGVCVMISDISPNFAELASPNITGSAAGSGGAEVADAQEGETGGVAVAEAQVATTVDGAGQSVDSASRAENIAVAKENESHRTCPTPSSGGVAFFILPEWKAPERVYEKGGSHLNWKNDETMNPFWAVRRISPEAGTLDTQVTNCELKWFPTSSVLISPILDTVLNSTTKMWIPYMCNTKPIKAGDELLMLKTVKAAPKKGPVQKAPTPCWKVSSKAASDIPKQRLHTSKTHR